MMDLSYHVTFFISPDFLSSLMHFFDLSHAERFLLYRNIAAQFSGKQKTGSLNYLSFIHIDIILLFQVRLAEYRSVSEIPWKMHDCC